jgi:hypothetical protein
MVAIFISHVWHLLSTSGRAFKQRLHALAVMSRHLPAEHRTTEQQKLCMKLRHWHLNMKRTYKGPEQIRNLQYVGHSPKKRQQKHQAINYRNTSKVKRLEVQKYIQVSIFK